MDREGIGIKLLLVAIITTLLLRGIIHACSDVNDCQSGIQYKCCVKVCSGESYDKKLCGHGTRMSFEEGLLGVSEGECSPNTCCQQSDDCSISMWDNAKEHRAHIIESCEDRDRCEGLTAYEPVPVSCTNGSNYTNYDKVVYNCIAGPPDSISDFYCPTLSTRAILTWHTGTHAGGWKLMGHEVEYRIEGVEENFTVKEENVCTDLNVKCAFAVSALKLHSPYRFRVRSKSSGNTGDVKYSEYEYCKEETRGYVMQGWLIAVIAVSAALVVALVAVITLYILKYKNQGTRENVEARVIKHITTDPEKGDPPEDQHEEQDSSDEEQIEDDTQQKNTKKSIDESEKVKETKKDEKQDSDEETSEREGTVSVEKVQIEKVTQDEDSKEGGHENKAFNDDEQGDFQMKPLQVDIEDESAPDPASTIRPSTPQL